MMSALHTLLPVNTETSLFGVQAVNNTMRGKEHGRSSLSCTALIQETLGKRNLTPREHIVDAGYIDAELLVSSAQDHHITLVAHQEGNYDRRQ